MGGTTGDDRTGPEDRTGRNGRTAGQTAPAARQGRSAAAAPAAPAAPAARTDPTDPRARRTRALLRTAVLDLAAERDADTIGVADITERANVNRATFYLHYRDRDDLLLDALHSSVVQLAEAAARCRPVRGAGPAVGPPSHLVRLLRHVDERRGLYARLLGPTGSARFVAQLRATLADAWCAQVGSGLPADRESATEPVADPVAKPAAVSEPEPLPVPVPVPEPLPVPVPVPEPLPVPVTVPEPVRLQAQCIAGALIAALAYWTGDAGSGSPETFAAALWPVLRPAAGSVATLPSRNQTEQSGSDSPVW